MNNLAFSTAEIKSTVTLMLHARLLYSKFSIIQSSVVLAFSLSSLEYFIFLSLFIAFPQGAEYIPSTSCL